MDKGKQADYITDAGIKVLRTPEDCFQKIKNFDFTSHYTTVDGMRMHYLDENSSANRVIVMLHGLPTWAYLYRNMIPFFAGRGFRVIVPDLIGFGKSDKPLEKDAYSYTKLVCWLEEFLFDQLKLSKMNFVLHDWGGLIGLRVVADHPEKFEKIIAMNTALPRLEGFNPVYFLWRSVAHIISAISYSKLMPLGMATKINKADLVPYDAPFPSREYKTAPIHLPKLVPVFPWHSEAKKNKDAWRRLGTFTKPFLTIFSAKDPFTKRVEEHFIKHVPGAKGQAHVKFKNAGHFIQEDQPEEVCRHILTFIEKNN